MRYRVSILDNQFSVCYLDDSRSLIQRPITIFSENGVKIADGRVDKVKMYLDIYYTINFIRKAQHNNPSKGKVFSYLKKLNKDCNYDLFDISMDKLAIANFIEVKGDDDQESLCFVKEFDKLVSIYIETADNYTQTENMDNIHPGNNESAKESDKLLSDVNSFFGAICTSRHRHLGISIGIGIGISIGIAKILFLSY